MAHIPLKNPRPAKGIGQRIHDAAVNVIAAWPVPDATNQMSTTTTPDNTDTKFSHWALVELMGHQRIAGLATEVNIAGKGFIRVDVPNEKGEFIFTRFYAPDAIYCVSPVDKQIAIGLAVKCASRPVNIYDLARLVEDKKVDEGQSQATLDDYAEQA